LLFKERFASETASDVVIFAATMVASIVSVTSQSSFTNVTVHSGATNKIFPGNDQIIFTETAPLTIMVVGFPALNAVLLLV
jgi:hypothetical protein